LEAVRCPTGYGRHMRGQHEPARQQTHAASSPCLRWWRVFPGEPAQLKVLRHWLADLLPPCDARDDVLTVACELSANAIRQTASGLPDGRFSVEVEWTRGAVRLVVGDGGGPSAPQLIQDPDSENGRGLLMVYGLSTAVTVSGGEEGRYAQADVPWVTNDGPRPQIPGWDEETAADLASLQERFPAAVVWFGQTTRQWWALVVTGGEDRLVVTSSPGELLPVLAAVHSSVPGYGRVGAGRLRAAEQHRS
jgi:anti-sigma regulatory factor (Ser/Thr protein kinase)